MELEGGGKTLESEKLAGSQREKPRPKSHIDVISGTITNQSPLPIVLNGFEKWVL